jgi:hypothetical protein
MVLFILKDNLIKIQVSLNVEDTDEPKDAGMTSKPEENVAPTKDKLPGKKN